MKLNVSNKKATLFITTEKSFVIHAPEVRALFVIAVLHACDIICQGPGDFYLEV